MLQQAESSTGPFTPHSQCTRDCNGFALCGRSISDRSIEDRVRFMLIWWSSIGGFHAIWHRQPVGETVVDSVYCCGACLHDLTPKSVHHHLRSPWKVASVVHRCIVDEGSLDWIDGWVVSCFRHIFVSSRHVFISVMFVFSCVRCMHEEDSFQSVGLVRRSESILDNRFSQETLFFAAEND